MVPVPEAPVGTSSLHKHNALQSIMFMETPSHPGVTDETARSLAGGSDESPARTHPSLACVRYHNVLRKSRCLPIRQAIRHASLMDRSSAWLPPIGHRMCPSTKTSQNRLKNIRHRQRAMAVGMGDMHCPMLSHYRPPASQHGQEEHRPRQKSCTLRDRTQVLKP